MNIMTSDPTGTNLDPSNPNAITTLNFSGESQAIFGAPQLCQPLSQSDQLGPKERCRNVDTDTCSSSRSDDPSPQTHSKIQSLFLKLFERILGIFRR